MEGDEAKAGGTVLAYLEDTYVFEGKGRLVGYGSDSRAGYVLLDSTIFYPQGGGQPSDVGTVRIGEKEVLLRVSFVGVVEGEVRHYIEGDAQLSREMVGQEVRLSIDRERRLENARAHTGGHLLTAIVESLACELVGVKGYHFPDGPYVEFSGKLCSLTKEELVSQIEEVARKKIEEGAAVTVSCSSDGAKSRFVQIAGYKAVPCGGTHLRSLDDLRVLRVRKVQASKEKTRVSYQTV